MHPGACVYTGASSAHYKNYVAYLSNFNVVLYQLEPFKYLSTLPAPADIQSGGHQEASGLTTMSISTIGQLAVSTRQGNLFVYDLPNLDKSVKSVSLDYKKLNQHVSTRIHSEVLI